MNKFMSVANKNYEIAPFTSHGIGLVSPLSRMGKERNAAPFAFGHETH